jgi:RNA-directed DNA polymerase
MNALPAPASAPATNGVAASPPASPAVALPVRVPRLKAARADAPPTGFVPISLAVDVQTQVYQATCDTARPVGGLMPWLLDRRNLAAAWERVAAADGADTPGPDGCTCASLRAGAAAWLARLADDLYHARYRPQPPRWVDLAKPGKPGAMRRIGILNIRDRVVQTALKQVLEPVLEPAFLADSFGFRPGRSVAGALAAAARLLSSGPRTTAPFAYAVPLDVADCFPTVDHALLLAELTRHVADTGVLRLVEACAQAGGSAAGRLWWQRTCGIVQGSALSPLLCNLALHSLDVAVARFGRDAQDGVRCLRYADDMLLLARDPALAQRGTALVRQSLRERHQDLGPVRAPAAAAAGVDWLGVRLQPRRLARPDRVDFGHHVPEAKVVSMLARLTEMTTPPSDKIDASAFNLARWIVSINDQLREWRQVYVFADNAAEVFRVLDEAASERVGALLQAVTGTHWSELQARYGAKLPRGFRTWQVPGGRLTVLSALAPEAPACLTRRPRWMRRARAGTVR